MPPTNAQLMAVMTVAEYPRARVPSETYLLVRVSLAGSNSSSSSSSGSSDSRVILSRRSLSPCSCCTVPGRPLTDGISRGGGTLLFVAPCPTRQPRTPVGEVRTPSRTL